MHKFRFLLIAFSLCYCIQLQAMDRFDQGLRAFEAGNFQQALDHFAAAQAAGRDDDELLYNIAICHYRLGQWSEANKLLSDLYLTNPEQDLIAYNLAVTEKKLGNDERARDIFLELALTSATSELAVLANRQYQLLSRTDATSRTLPGGGTWLASADMSLGSDDNVTDPADLSGSNQSDTFMETLLTARWYSAADPHRDWVVDGFVYLSRYTEVDDYDIDMGDVGFKKYTGTDFGFWYLGGRADTSQLGGEGYLQALSFDLGSGGQLDGGRFWNVRYRYRALDSLSREYDPLKGSNQRINLDYGGRAGRQSRWKINYRYEFDDRDDAEDDLTFSSYSAHRHSLGASWAFTSGDWRTSMRVDYRRSDFLDDNMFIDGSTAGRQDNRYKLTLRGSWFFTPNWSLTAEYGYTDNDSSIDSYDYDRQVLMLGIGWQI